jgi:hypothetical protein
VNEGAFTEAFTALLGDLEFLAEGGTLAFGLRHVYPIKDDLKHVYNVLKGSDAVVYQSVRANLFEPVLYMYYKNDGLGVEGVLIDRVVNFTQYYDPEGQDLVQFLHSKGGIIVSRERERLRDLSESLYATAEQVEWVTPMTTINQKEDAYISYGNESTLDFVYGEVCLVVRIGKAGDRLAFLTAAELKKRRRSRRR